MVGMISMRNLAILNSNEIQVFWPIPALSDDAVLCRNERQNVSVPVGLHSGLRAWYQAARLFDDLAIAKG